MNRSDGFWALGLLIVGIGVVVRSSGFPSLPGQDVGPATFPVLLGGLLAASGAAMAVGAWRGGTVTVERSVPPPSARQWIALAGLFAVPVSFILLSDALGFVLAVAPLAALAMSALASRNHLAHAGLALAASIAIYLVFTRVLLVLLGQGPFGTPVGL